jgi:hypothetical protein
MNVINGEIGKRRQRMDVQARQGQRQFAIPDGGFMRIVGGLNPRHAKTGDANKKQANSRADPSAFKSFLEQFGLTVVA